MRSSARGRDVGCGSIASGVPFWPIVEIGHRAADHLEDRIGTAHAAPGLELGCQVAIAPAPQEGGIFEELGQHLPTSLQIAPHLAFDQSQAPARGQAALMADIVALAVQYGRYGYRRIAAMLRSGRRVKTRIVIAGWRRHYNTIPPLIDRLSTASPRDIDAAMAVLRLRSAFGQPWRRE